MAYYAPYYRNNYMTPMQTAPQPTYQPIVDNGGIYQPNYQNAPQSVVAATDPMLWVLNENEAVAYPVLANNSVVLWDKNAPTIYVKSVNAQGVPSMRILDFTERTPENAARAQTIDTNKYVGIDAFNALKAEFEALTARFDKLSKKPTKEKVAEVE